MASCHLSSAKSQHYENVIHQNICVIHSHEKSAKALKLTSIDRHLKQTAVGYAIIFCINTKDEHIMKYEASNHGNNVSKFARMNRLLQNNVAIHNCSIYFTQSSNSKLILINLPRRILFPIVSQRHRKIPIYGTKMMS